ncbi:MAG: NAD-dependent epimerase/dehydratase family protein [Candidatus Hodarchaeales archaeon]|jgi:threonine 3-dehydrogenase
MTNILVTGSLGQIGTELIPQLEKKYNVIASDIREPPEEYQTQKFVHLDVTKFSEVEQIVQANNIDWIIHNACILSVKGEETPLLALKVNARGTENVLQAARKNNTRIFAPSSIAAFGPTTPKNKTPDLTIMRPTTIYGITKVYTELMGEYYFKKWGVDFRSLRYPGIISSEALPGGGTTDYAVDIFYEALQHKKYTSFLKKSTALPMMYMPDCLKSTISILEAKNEKLTQRVYNVTAMSFTPQDLANAIKKLIPDFKITYKSDYRQKIAETWPLSIDDSKAREDWGWKPEYDLNAMTTDMIEKLNIKLNNNH